MNEDDPEIAALKRVGVRHVLNNLRFDVRDFECLNISFSLSGEDLALRKMFKPKLQSESPGFYLDVGCFDPKFGSNTYLFYCYHWRGICVDANPKFAKPYKVFRPDDVFVNAAVGTSGETVYFAQSEGNVGMSMIARSPDAFGKNFNAPVQLQTRSIKSILDEHGPKDGVIDLMSMDIEGSEMEALQSNDWNKYRPRVIVIETQDVDPGDVESYPTVAYLRQRGYVVALILCGSVVLKSTEFGFGM
jgi:FkbM family methyltransferase